MKIVKGPVAIVLLLLFLFSPTVLLYGQFAAGAAVIAAAGAIKMMLGNLIEQTAGEVKSILQEAFNEIEELESKLAGDLAELEEATFEDLDELTYDRMTQLDNTLNELMAELAGLESTINTDIALNIRDTVAQLNVTWDGISSELDEKIAKIQHGVLNVVDMAAMKITRFVLIALGGVLIIIGVLVLRKYKRPGIISLTLGVVIFVFSLTPLFVMAVSNLDFYTTDYEMDGKIPDPVILSTWPRDLSLDYEERGDISFIGTHFISAVGSSRLLRGTDSNQLTGVVEQASFAPTVINFPMQSFTNKSGDYFVQLKRADDAVSGVMTLYVQKPEEIPVRIDYKIWQKGKYLTTDTDVLKIRDVYRCCYTCSGRRSYSYPYTDSFWEVYDFTRSVINQRYMSDHNAAISHGNLNVSFKLACKRLNRAGWYRADYTVKLRKDERSDTKQLASSGTKTLYFNPETKEFKSRALGVFQNFKAEWFDLSHLCSGVRIALCLEESVPKIITTPREFRMADIAVTPVLQADVQKIVEIEATRTRVLPINIWGKIRNTETVNKEIKIGSAPDIDGFTPDAGGTYYDAVIIFPDFTRECLNQNGLCTVRDTKGNIIMTLDIKGESLYVKWLSLPE